MKLPARLLALNEKIRRTSPAYMVLVALLVGILGGYGAVGFRMLISGLQEVLWDGEGGFSIARIQDLPWYHVMAVPTLAGLVVGLLVWAFAREAKGHGVPEVMEAVALRNGFIRARVVFVKAVASGLCIASGGSVGREGPIVQIGSALGSTIGQALE
ncbi:MAG: chloride channel protein, partial [Bacteroidetes bacterium]